MLKFLRPVLYIALSCLIISCENPVCDGIDARFAEEFEKQLQTIKLSQRNKEGLIEPLAHAHLYMSAVTGIESGITNLEFPLYQRRMDFKRDVAQWERWFDENGCLMTLEKADSLYRAYAHGVK